jgi:hypothetical protein
MACQPREQTPVPRQDEVVRVALVRTRTEPDPRKSALRKGWIPPCVLSLEKTMIPENAVDAREPYILIEGPRWGDAEFYANWLLAAARADRLCKTAIKNDAKFSKQIELLQEFRHPLDFDKCSSAVFLALEEHRVTTLFPVASAMAEAVAMMARRTVGVPRNKKTATCIRRRKKHPAGFAIQGRPPQDASRSPVSCACSHGDRVWARSAC